MKREFLEGLKLESDQIEKIMAEHGKTIQAEQAKTAAKDAELKAANETISGLQTSIKKFDGVDIDKLQRDAKNWEQKYNDDLAAERQKTEMLKKEYTLKGVLAEKGVTDPDYLIFKHGGVEKFAFDGEGKPVGIDETIKGYKENSPALFQSDNSVQVDFGAGNDGGSSGSGENVNAMFNAAIRAAAK